MGHVKVACTQVYLHVPAQLRETGRDSLLPVCCNPRHSGENIMTHTIQALILSFFHTYLRDQAGCSPNTIQSYCECIRLLIQFCCREQDITADELDMETISDTVCWPSLTAWSRYAGTAHARAINVWRRSRASIAIWRCRNPR